MSRMELGKLWGWATREGCGGGVTGVMTLDLVCVTGLWLFLSGILE